MKPEIVADYQCKTGENPLWHPDEEKLYWVDIPRGRLFRYDPATREHEKCFETEPIGGFTIQADGTLLLFVARGAVRVWHDGIVRTVVEEIPRERGSRFNDVIADPEGRVYCGTMSTSDQKGRLYRLDTDGSLKVMVEGVGTSNGMGFTREADCMYHTDTRAHRIYLYDYDRGTGALSNRRVFVHVTEGPGRPDGMTVDEEGAVWSALWEGSCVVRYSREGEELGRVGFPARKVSCPTFGGPNCGDMYVTTAGGEDRENNGEGAGALFRFDPGVNGTPEFRSRIQL